MNYPRDYKHQPAAKARTIQRRKARKGKVQAWLASLALATSATACTSEPERDTLALASYSLTIETVSGNLYVVDYNMNATDCADRLSDTLAHMSAAQWAVTRDMRCTVDMGAR